MDVVLIVRIKAGLFMISLYERKSQVVSLLYILTSRF